MFKKPAAVPPDGVAPVVDSVPNTNLFEYGTYFVSLHDFIKF